MREYTEEDIKRFEHIIDTHDREAALAELSELHRPTLPSSTVARPQPGRVAVPDFSTRDGRRRADGASTRTTVWKLISEMPAEKIAQQIDHLDTDDAVDLIQQLDEDEREEILSHIDDVEQAGDIIDLLKYAEDTAGGLMGTEMIVVNENRSMPECIKQMRLAGRGHGRNLLCVCGRQRLPPARHTASENDAHAPVGVENQACDGGRPGEREG